MKKAFKNFLIILLVCAMALATGCKNTTNITKAWLEPGFDYYEYYNGATFCDELDKVIPMSNEIGDYTEATFYRYKNTSLFAMCADNSFCLDIKYDKENYSLEKQNTLQNCEFQSEIIEDGYGYFLLPFIERVIGSYTVKVVKDLSTSLWDNGTIPSSFPKCIGLVAYSDKDMQIRYCYLEFISLDFFYDAEGMEDYVRKSIPLGW